MKNEKENSFRLLFPLSRFLNYPLNSRDFPIKHLSLQVLILFSHNSSSTNLFLLLVELFSSFILGTIIIITLILGLLISRYYHQRHRQVNAKHFSSRLTSTSCEQFSFPSQTIVNETTHIIKNSSSWPEANMFSRQDQEQIQSSSSSSSSQLEPTSLTFSLRWDEKIKSLFVRVISARDLFRQKPYRQSLIIDSYVRIQLISANNEPNPSSKIFLLISFS